MLRRRYAMGSQMTVQVGRFTRLSWAHAGADGPLAGRVRPTGPGAPHRLAHCLRAGGAGDVTWLVEHGHFADGGPGNLVRPRCGVPTVVQFHARTVGAGADGRLG